MESRCIIRSGEDRAEMGPAADLNIFLIDETPRPIIEHLDRLHHGVLGVAEMCGGMLVIGSVAASDMTARQAQTQVYPFRTDPQALLAAGRTGENRPDPIEMRTNCRIDS